MKKKYNLIASIWMFLLIFLIFLANQLPIAVTIPLALIIILAPLLREFTKFNNLDERQQYYSHFSGHIAYYVYLLLLFLIIINKYATQSENPPNEIYMLLIVPITVKFYISIFQNYSAISAGQKIALIFGLILLIFNLLSHSMFTVDGIFQALPAVILLVFVYFTKRITQISAVVFLLFAFVALYFFIKANFDIYLKILMITVVSVPFLMSGALILFSATKNEESDE